MALIAGGNQYREPQANVGFTTRRSNSQHEIPHFTKASQIATTANECSFMPMIVIVGAGLAGLSAARTLHGSGYHNFLILEQSSHPGGRVWTINHHGFRLDQGFQVALSSYPVFQSRLSLQEFSPHAFGSGALVEEQAGKLHLLANPLRHPKLLFNALRSNLPLADRLRLLRLAGSCLRQDRASPQRDSGISSSDFLQQHGFSQSMIRSFFEPFFGGVFLDPELQTDAALLRYYLKHFVIGRACLPSGGIGRISEDLAERIPHERIRYHCGVENLGNSKNGWHLKLTDGTTQKAEQVILACDPASTCRLLDWPIPEFHRTRVVYYSSKHPVYDGPWLVLPSLKPRLAQHFVQISNIDPSLTPNGMHLLSATVVDDQELDPEIIDQRVAGEIMRLFPNSKADLQPLQQIVVPRALPKQNAGFRKRYQELQNGLSETLHLAGDLNCNASLQNALESGHQAAQRALMKTVNHSFVR